MLEKLDKNAYTYELISNTSGTIAKAYIENTLDSM